MPVTAYPYGGFLQSLVNKEIDLDTDTIKVMLTTATYVPNKDTHRYKSSVTNEVSGTGYTAGGVALASKTVTYDAATDTLVFDAADVSWNPATITARYAVIFSDAGATDAAKALIALVDFGADVVASGGPFNITWAANGILAITA